MTRDERQVLRAAATVALNATRLHSGMHRVADWQLQTSNSFRRIGTHGDGDVLCAVMHPSDRQPDLLAPRGVLDYIVAAQPRIVLELIDRLDAAEQMLSRLAEVEIRLDETDRKFREAQILAEQLRAVAKGVVT